ncbi:hypothetical protein PVK06_023962 [Gossypium arboreum]|uniref:Uncharacterized protein n=1 Tax=Gossypium arboreum TaxID=29729 RepID=A0ABR0PCJ3_GOSAR|nr:hypothetical protein PVK06_023962 [Gossypium arboreum]
MHRDFKADPLSLSVYPPFNLLSYLSPMKLSSQTSFFFCFYPFWSSSLFLFSSPPVVPEAQKFRTSGNDPEFEGKLDQMFMRIVATGDKAWAPSSGTLRSDFFEDVNNEIPEENEEENVRHDVHILNDVHISNDVQIGGNGKKRKNLEISSSQFKTRRKKSSKQIGGAARLSSQIEKLCNAADNMSQATSSLTPVMDPYGIPEAVKVLDSMSEEVPEASPLYFFALRLLLNKDK